MRIPLRALLSLLVLLGLSPSGWTQPIPSDATKRVPFAFEIVRTGASQGNSMAVTVRGTALERLVPDGLGVVYSTPTVNTRAATAGKPLVLGTARLVSIAGEEAEVMLRPRRPGDKQLLPRTGDVVALPIRVPRSTYEGYFLQHLQLGITLTDSSEVPIATPETIFELRGEADELRLVATLVAGLRAAGASLLARIDGGEVLPEVVVTPLPRGLYAGRRPVDVLAGATETDVLHLLDYLEEYPQQLVGARLQLASILLVWVSANAPLGERSLRTLLAEAPPAALDSLVEAYAGDHDAAFLPTWRSEAHAARDQERFEDAYFLYDLNLRIARTRSGAVWRKQAQLARQDLNALVNRLADNADRHLSANRPAKALETTVRGTVLFEKAFETGTAGVSRSDAGRLWYARGLALHALQRLDEARAAYDLAYDFYGTAATKSGLQAQSRIRTRTASLERERGFFRAARNAYIEVAVRAAFLDDLEGEADALDELGYVMQQLGFPRLALAHWRKAAYLHRRSGVLTDVGYSLSATGSALWTLGQRDDAIAAHQQAIGVRSKTGDLPGEAYSWVQLGGLYGESGNPTAALDAYARADSLYAKADDASGQASVRSVRASVFFNQGDYVRALPLYQEALDGYTTAGDRTGRATTLNQLGDTYTGLRRYRDALAHYEDALELRRAIGDRSGEVQDLADLGTLASEGRYDRVAADRYFQTALALAQRTGDRGGAALAQGYYGRFLQQAGLFDEAQAALDDALAYWVAADNRQGEAWTRIDLGALAELQGDFAGAFEQYRTALAIAEATGDRARLTVALVREGDLLATLGRFDEADTLHARSLAVSDDIQNLWGQANAYLSLGGIAQARTDYRAALDHFARADSLYDRVGSDLARAAPINNRGLVFLAQGDYDRALAAFDEVRALYRAANFEDQNVLIAEQNRVRVLLEQEQWDEALAGNQRAFALAQSFGLDRLTAVSLYHQGRLHLERPGGDPALAQDALQRAVVLVEATGEQLRQAEYLGFLGQARLAAGNVGGAETALTQAIALADALGTPQYVWEPTYTLALVREQQGRDAEAVAELRRAVEAMEAVRSRVVGGEEAQRRFAQGGPKVRVYEALVAALLEQGQTEDALAYLNRSYSDDLRAQFDGFVASADEAETARLREARVELDQLAAQQARALANDRTEQAEAFAARLSVAQTEYRALLTEEIRTNPMLRERLPETASSIQGSHSRLDSTLAVLTYLVGEERLFLFVATRDTVVAEVLRVSVDEVRGLVRDFRSAIATPTEAARVRSGSLGGGARTPDATGYAATRRQLFDLLIAPALPRLEGRSRLAIVPNGPLYDLPFAALPAPTPDGTADPNRFLVEDRTLFYIPNLSVLRPDGLADVPIRIRAFGNAATDSLAALPFAEQEVEVLRRLYPDSAKVFLGEAATETQVKTTSGAHTVLHLATHGVLAYPFERSFLALAPDGTEDGRLTIDEIWGSRLGAYRLVTLSACESALGDTDVSNWPINPALSFLDIGAQAVVASLWKVDDAATSTLMQAFYTRLADGDTAAALRDAQTALLANEATRHPYYWAPFVLLGDDQ